MKTTKESLRLQCSGVDDPSKMGTTGLVAWVLHGVPSMQHPRNRWERFKVATRIIKKRGLSISLFTDAVLATGHAYGIHLRRFYSATRRVCHGTTLRSEFVTWDS